MTQTVGMLMPLLASSAFKQRQARGDAMPEGGAMVKLLSVGVCA
jgi:hypothetical protein